MNLSSLIGIFWSIFIIVWLISAMGSKKNMTGTSWWRGVGIRIFILIIVFIFFRSKIFVGLSRHHIFISQNLLISNIGVVLCALGIALAIWARFFLGRNWGTPRSIKENPELITTGPYSYIRHPIYTGVLLAMLGSTLAISILGLIVLVFGSCYFFYSAKKEEELMRKQFPKQYPEYMNRTKMLIPFVF